MSYKSAIEKIIDAYTGTIIRLYVRIRFHILRRRFLDEIGQYLPKQGKFLDIGCGFGLFSLYYAMERPGAQLHGIDLNGKRIAHARQASEHLGLTNTHYREGSAVGLALSESFDAIYMLDIVHHIPPASVAPLIHSLHQSLPIGGRLLIKDVNDSPAYQRWFTWWLDKAMDPKTPVHYWSQEELKALLEKTGFEVFVHHMVDYLPYPHILYVCRKLGVA